MKNQVLKIDKKFYDSLSDPINRKVLKIYGYNSVDDFFISVIKKLNSEYSFLNIDKVEFLSAQERSVYHMYNGYIDGDFLDYDLITVSFTTIMGKEGNVFMSQQLMPLITSKQEKDKSFLINNRIKKICLLTTHKSKIFSNKKNEISDSGISNIQMSVKYVNTIGFDVIEIFHIKNLNTNSKYYNIDQLIDHANYLQSKKKNNSQFPQIINKEGVYFANFENNPVGQEVKFFSLKLYAATILLQGKKIDISGALKKTNDLTLIVLQNFIDYLSKIKDFSRYEIFTEEDEAEKELENALEIEETDDIKINKLQKKGFKPIYTFNKKGKKVFKTQRKFKFESFYKHKYLCACDDKKGPHLYFTSDATNKTYVEGHHMIPMEYQDQYWSDRGISLDRTDNLIPLCPHCHSKIHKSIKTERIQILSDIYNKYENLLKNVDNEINFQKFVEFYNIYIY